MSTETQTNTEVERKPRRDRWLVLLLALIFCILGGLVVRTNKSTAIKATSEGDTINNTRRAARTALNATLQLQSAMDLADDQIKRAAMSQANVPLSKKSNNPNGMTAPSGLYAETATTNAVPHKTPKPPIITTSTNSAGKEIISIQFPEVVTADGQTIARDASFVGLYGENLVFRRTDETSFSLPAEQLDPYLLKMAGLDVGMIKIVATQKKNQQDKDSQKAFEDGLDKFSKSTSQVLMRTRQMQQLSYDLAANSDKDIQSKLDEIQRIKDQTLAITAPPQRYYYIYPMQSYGDVSLNGGLVLPGPYISKQLGYPGRLSVNSGRLPAISGRSPFVAGRMGETGYGFTIYSGVNTPVSSSSFNMHLTPTPAQ